MGQHSLPTLTSAISPKMKTFTLLALFALVALASSFQMTEEHDEFIAREYPGLSPLAEWAKKIYEKAKVYGKAFLTKLLPAIKQSAKECALKLANGKRSEEEIARDLDTSMWMMERSLMNTLSEADLESEEKRFLFSGTGSIMSALLHVKSECMDHTLNYIKEALLSDGTDLPDPTDVSDLE